MTQIDLTALNSKELRRLLDSARRQGQPAQTLEILREMAARREREGAGRIRRPKGGAEEHRIIALDFRDPMEPDEEPPQAEAVYDPPPLTLDPPGRAAEPEPPFSAPAPRAQGWAHWGALIFAIGLAFGTAGGWWAAGLAGRTNQPSPAQASPPRPTQLAVESPPSAPVAAQPATEAAPPTSLVPDPQQQAATEAPPPAASTTTAPAAAATPPAPSAAPVAPVATAAAPAPEETAAPVKPAKVAKAEAGGEAGCAIQPTPADRTICETPKLRRLQGELRTAYAEALKAHQDRALLRERELAWRDERNNITDPDQLARLYTARIEKLKAATADALRQR